MTASTSRPPVLVIDAPPEAMAHLRHRCGQWSMAVESHRDPDGLTGALWTAMVVWCRDAVAMTGAMRTLSEAPLILLLPPTTVAHWAAALDAGADACLADTLPPSVAAAHLSALLRRLPPPPLQPDELRCGRLIITMSQRRAQVEGRDLRLNRREFDLLAHLVLHRGRIHRRADLLRAVWSPAFNGDSNTVDVHIAWLRQKLGDSSGVRITTLRGIGYRLDEL